MQWQLAGSRARAVRAGCGTTSRVQRETQGKQHALLQVMSLLVAHTFYMPYTVFPSVSFHISHTPFVWFQQLFHHATTCA